MSENTFPGAPGAPSPEKSPEVPPELGASELGHLLLDMV